ncbi:MAG: asparaginase [Alphaproteobacteria bacterium]|nr:MAG: asparaginase [Alphaproteobacteria bacterium]
MTSSPNPVLVTLTRGKLPESRHRGALIVMRDDGRIIASLGDTAAPVFPRSAVKALQAIPLVESGAADAFRLTDAELAIACASHGGEPEHVSTVRGLLEKTGGTESDLACGAHWPTHAASARALFAAGGEPGRIHNNCSGKHAGMIALSRFLGVEPEGYEAPEHPVQKRIRAVLEEMSGASLSADVCGTDGCSVPTWAMPLESLARAFARFSRGRGLPEVRSKACARLRQACFAAPFMVAGSERFCTLVMQRLKGKAFVKTGAEGVFCAALPEAGVGIALKIDDGAARASEAVTAGLLEAMIADAGGTLEGLGEGVLTNWAGLEVGARRFAGDLKQLLAALREEGAG